MKLITWNCNLNLKNKFDALATLKPDIAIIQECEELPENYFPDCKYIWHGLNEKKGIGILSFGHDIEVDKIHNEKFVYFVPVNISDYDIKLLAVWAYNHRSSRFDTKYEGKTIHALEYYKEWITQHGNTILAGDFNNSVVWDKPRKPTNFKVIDETLVSYGLKSEYHKCHGVSFGAESDATLYFRKNPKSSYHIDYVYAGAGIAVEDVYVGSPGDWLELSDHIPVSAVLGVKG